MFIQNIKINNTPIVWNNLLEDANTNDTINVPPNITEEISIFGKPLSIAERDQMKKKFGDIYFNGFSTYYNVPQNLVLPYNNNSITVDFIAIEPARSNLMEYQYFLEGYDDEWSPVSNKTTATFGNIFEGTYTLKIRAKFSGLAKEEAAKWSEPISYTFTVLPPWYRTWWAYTLYALLFLFALRVFVKWRERNLRIEKEKLEQTVVIRTAEVVAEKKKSDDLLLNILPEEVAEELKAKGSADAKLIDHVTVLFTDFKGFTALAEKLSPKELVSDLNICFSEFDRIMQKHGIEKIKTIGDSYMAAGGLPTPNDTHASDVVKAAFEIRDFIEEGKQRKIAAGLPYFEIRIGVHTGPVVAGIVGVKKIAYDIWGDTVNTASRMESSGEIGKVNISETSYDLVKDKFKCEFRGEVKAKGKGLVKMYFVESV